MFVRADPEPHHDIAVFKKTNDAITSANASRVHGFGLVHTLEVKTRVVRVGGKDTVSNARLVAHLIRQRCVSLTERSCNLRLHSFSGSRGSVRPARYSCLASSASRASKSWERSNSSSHRRSDSSSASMNAANASCSSSGSFAVSAMTLSRSRPISAHFSSAGLLQRGLRAEGREVGSTDVTPPLPPLPPIIRPA